MNHFLAGCVFIAASVVAAFFLGYWRESKDRFFLFFSLAFLMLGIERIPLAFMHVPTEAVPYVYLIRLLAFVLMGVAILEKNRVSNRRE